MIRWIVRGTYTFTDDAPSIDEVDRIAAGEVRHARGGARHAIGSGPWKTELEWGFETVERAREAELALKSVSVLHEVHAKALERILKPEEFQISQAGMRAGRARCRTAVAVSPQTMRTRSPSKAPASGRRCSSAVARATS